MLTAFLLLPIALFFFWRFILNTDLADLIALSIIVVAIASVHTLGIVMLALVILFFGALSLLLERKGSRRSWWLVAAPLLGLVAFSAASHLVFSPYLYSLDHPLVQTWVRLSKDRLILSSPLLYSAHPSLIDHPLILMSLGLTPMLVGHLRTNRAARFLFANSIGISAFTFGPLSTALLGQVITPWEIWRITWILPAALIMSFFVQHLNPKASLSNLIHRRLGNSITRIIPLAAILIGVVGLARLDLNKSWQELTAGHRLPPSVLAVMSRALRFSKGASSDTRSF